MARWFEFPRRSTREDAVRAIQDWSESWRVGGPVRCWAICSATTSAILGGVELRQLAQRDVNLSYWVIAPWRRRRIATLAARLALDYAATTMGATRAVIKVLEGNLASLSVARHLGAQLVDRVPSDAGGTLLVFHRALP
jgi:RimJ/RimL family protein N-acetyltransferase